MTNQDAIAALADPSRRAIVEALRTGAQPVSQIANGLPISRPAVSQHLKVLTDAGLLTCQSEGTRRLYALSPEGIAAMRAYLDELWDDALACFSASAKGISNDQTD